MSDVQTMPTQLAANQKFCHGCAKTIHNTAPQCPHCGAPQQVVMTPAPGYAPQMQQHAHMARSTSDQKHCDKCGTVMHVSAGNCPSCGAAQAGGLGGKSRTTAAWLAILVGGLGAHHFYLGNTIRGLIYLAFCWTGISAIVGFIEGISYFSKNDRQFANMIGQ